MLPEAASEVLVDLFQSSVVVAIGGRLYGDDLVMLDVTNQVTYQSSAKCSDHEDEQHWKKP